MSGSNKNKKGFTLMEILATIVLIAVIIPVVMKGISITTHLASDSAGKLQAVNLAENKLAEILLEKQWLNGSQSGNFTDEYSAYRWQMDAVDSIDSGLKQIDVWVFWDRRGRERSMHLTTLVNDEN